MTVRVLVGARRWFIMTGHEVIALGVLVLGCVACAALGQKELALVLGGAAAGFAAPRGRQGGVTP